MAGNKSEFYLSGVWELLCYDVTRELFGECLLHIPFIIRF